MASIPRHQQYNWVMLTLYLSVLLFSSAAYAHPRKYSPLACRNLFKNDAALFDKWRWRGPVMNFDTNLYEKNKTGSGSILPVVAVSYQGVLEVCGTFGGFYTWATISDTLTTWVLPLCGLILQMPWESNKFRATMGLFFRWLGSPIASLMCVFWNISVTGKCAKMADMGMAFKAGLEDEWSDASNMRDSFSILATMNQFELSYDMERNMTEEWLMDLVMEALFDMRRNERLIMKRHEVAEEVRRTRRRGVVPVLISFVWYLFAMGISCAKAFVTVGDSTTAHNLALGMLVGWLPVLVVASIVDRNPMDSDKMCERLNELMHLVQHPDDRFDIFASFAGQGRKRWHYGIAHSVLAMMEIRSEGRNTRPVDWWTIAHPEKVYYSMETNIEQCSDRRFLLKFDWSELTQMVGATVVVVGCCLGALTLSFFTPTVGFGCRSFTYLLYACVAVFLMVTEMLLYPWVRRPLRRPQPTQSFIVRRFLRTSEFRYFVETIFVLFDVASSLFLAYIVWAQTVGGFNTTYCRASMIGGNMGGLFGGYLVLDADDSETIKKYFHVERYWLGGTVLALVVVCVPLIYLCITWLMQSFLWSVDRVKSTRGLKRTRRWRKLLKGVGFYGIFGGGLKWST